MPRGASPGKIPYNVEIVERRLKNEASKGNWPYSISGASGLFDNDSGIGSTTGVSV
jgi:hypothetical protein